MNQRIKQLWIEDLLANQDKQTTGGLLSEITGNSCCLGRLCLLAEKEGIVDRVGTTDGGWVKFGNDWSTGYLPPQVQDWAELSSEAGEYVSPEDTSYAEGSLAEDNDNGKTFAEIAEIIREYF